MNSLLAQGLRLGASAEGLTDPSGHRLRVSGTPPVTHIELLDPEEEVVALAWRVGPAAARPSGFPEGVPFLSGLSCAAVADGGGLTVTWPDPEEDAASQAVPSALLGGRARPSDPVAEALRRYEAHGGLGDRSEMLAAALDGSLAESTSWGWVTESDEPIGGPGGARVIRLRRQDLERTLTLSSGLGVSSLVLMDRPRRSGDRPPDHDGER